MVPIFNLWNRFFPGDDTGEFDVTMANAPRLKNGTPELIVAALDALDVPNRPREWRVRPFRSQFYSDYPDPGESWQDRWPIGWEVKVWLEGPIRGLESRLEEYPKRISVLDSTWDGSNGPPPLASDALLISVFGGDAQMPERAGKKVAEHAQRAGVMAPAQISIHAFGANRHQLRVCLPKVAFPDWIRIGDELKQVCAQMGGILNRRDIDLLNAE